MKRDVEREKLLGLIKQFYDLLDRTDDSKESFRDFLDFIKILLRTKFRHYVIPSIEIVSLIKKRKPIVFRYFQLLAEKDVNISILVGSVISEERAEERINRLIEELEGNAREAK